MNNSFLNTGNKAFVRVAEIICIEAADSDKVRRILARANLKRKSPEVPDLKEKIKYFLIAALALFALGYIFYRSLILSLILV